MKEENKVTEELVIGTWYKFAPYSGNPDAIWYMKCKGKKEASAYIEWSQSDKVGISRKLYGSGTFGSSYSYYTVTFKELKWLQEVEKGKLFFPIEEMKFDEVINDYPIY